MIPISSMLLDDKTSNPTTAALSVLEDEVIEPFPAQAISGRDINPTRLMSLLRTKFGVGSYDVNVSFT
jgi:hypothetical protein